MFPPLPWDPRAPYGLGACPHALYSDSTDGADPPAPPSDPLHRVPGRDANRPFADPGQDGASLFPGTLFHQPHSVLVFGPSRPLVRLTLFALASRTNPRFHWVEFSPPATERTPCDPVRLGWIPQDRLWLVDPARPLEPNEGAMADSLSKMISTEEPPESRSRFAEFLRLPDLSQQIIASQVPNGHPGVVAVSEVQQASETFAPEQVGSILALHQELGFSVMVGHYRPPRNDRDVFDFVFRLQGEGERLEDWKHYQLTCEKGATVGPLRDRRPVPVGGIPLLYNVLSRARPAGT